MEINLKDSDYFELYTPKWYELPLWAIVRMTYKEDRKHEAIIFKSLPKSIRVITSFTLFAGILWIIVIVLSIIFGFIT